MLLSFRLSVGLVYVGIALAADDITRDAYRDFILLVVVDIPAIIIAIICSNRYVYNLAIVVFRCCLDGDHLDRIISTRTSVEHVASDH